MAILLHPAEISFHNNITAVNIMEENEYGLAKEVCDEADEAFKVGESHGANSLILSKSIAQMGRALWELGDIYNAMWKYEEALSLNCKLSFWRDLEKVYEEVKVSLSQSDDLSVEKILAAGDMIKRIYINRIRKYESVNENPILFPRAPRQVFVDAFSKADDSHSSIRHQEGQLQYDAEVDLYRALECLELRKRITVLHSFKFSKGQACLFSGSEESSEGEQDFVVIVRDSAIVLIEVKSPLNITNNSFNRNVIGSRKQLGRAKSLITDICNIWNINQSTVDVLEYTAFPKANKETISKFPSYKKFGKTGIIDQDDVQNFGSWWEDNITAYLTKVCMEREENPKDIRHLTSTLVGIWCINKNDSCDIEICSLGHSVKEIDDAVRSAEITQNKLKPISKGVKKSPKIFQTYFDVDCLTDTQEAIFEDDNVAQFIMGPAGSGKTLLLLGKMIQIFHRADSQSGSQRKFLIITGTYELDALTAMLKKAGMKTCNSHSVVRTEALELQKNDRFQQAFQKRECNDIDAFILHHVALTDPTFWPKQSQGNVSAKDILSNLVNGEYNLFIDDFHNALDTILSILASTKYLEYYARNILGELVIALRKRSVNKSNMSDSPYLWLIYDHSQMTLAKKKESRIELNFETTFFRRMITYVRDFEDVLKMEMKKDINSDNPLFRVLARNLRNTVDINKCIENVYIDHSRFWMDNMSKKDRIFDILELPKLYPKIGHFIHGPKPIFFLVENSNHQEYIERAIIVDVLEELLKDGKLCPKDIAIITDSYWTCEEPHSGKSIMDKMVFLKRHGFEGVTVRVTEDKDSIQATEWKAVIHIADLIESNESLQNEPQYMIDLLPILKANLTSTSESNYNHAKSLLETNTKIAYSPLYVGMSRARAFLVVIGRIGNWERKRFCEMKNMFHMINGQRLPSRSEVAEYRELPKNDEQKTVKEGEHDYYKRSNFVYKTIPDSPMHAKLENIYPHVY